MKGLKILLSASVLGLWVTASAFAQTAVSLFMRSDSLQIAEYFSESGNEYRTVGHHGPAVENSHFALRIYFNDSGAIDVYSKSGRGMELLRYLWYPNEHQQAALGAGCDEYKVGSTVGAGGIALWDGSKEVKLVATKGRRARAGRTKGGSFIEMTAYGVAYRGESVDICIRVDMSDRKRTAVVTASELSGRPVQFLTGVNYHGGEQTKMGENYVAAWGVHPADVSAKPSPVGVALKFNKGKFLPPEKTDDMLRVISKPASRITTTLFAASSKEAELRNAASFISYVEKNR